MHESELVVVCHCEKHAQLYTVKGDELDRPIDNKSVSFVDPGICETRTWDKILTASKQYVWAFNCPIGPAIRNRGFNRGQWWVQTLLEILENSKRVLKPGGQFITGISSKPGQDESILEKFINVHELSDWNIQIVEASDFAFNLGKMYEGSLADFKRRLIVFTKVTGGGKRGRKRHTRRRKAKARL
jgi:SAM-dependent methyltransferase